MDKISFTGDQGKNTGSILVTVKDTIRGSTGEATLNYQIQNKPEISLPNILGSSFTAGKFGNASGITVNDIDFEDLNQDGQKDTNEQSQTILMTIVSDGGKIGLDDPNDNASNTTPVVVDIFEDERGANILGKSSAINTVLSSLQFKGSK